MTNADVDLTERVREALTAYRVRDAPSVHFCSWVIRELRLLADPVPPPKMTTREIRRRARGARSERERRAMRAQEFQTFRGDVVIPIGPHGKRPERAIIHALQLMDAHLRARGLRATKRWACLAAVLRAAGCYADDVDILESLTAAPGAGAVKPAA